MKKMIALTASLLVTDYSLANQLTCHVESGKTIIPLVELYTSEGCSSCPPADAWLSKQTQRTDIKANFLAFHVDYWDDIGWPDRFARPAYTERQYSRVRRNGSSQVYTPQVMIGEQTGVSWSWPDRTASVIGQANEQAAKATIRLDAKGEGAAWKARVSLSSVNAVPEARWYLAVYQDGLSSQVRAGENAGKLLRHDRVVRQWLGPYSFNGKMAMKDFNIALSHSAATEQTGLLAVLENAANGQVLQSLKLPLSQCKPAASK